MLSLQVIDNMAEMCREHQLKFVQGEFKAYREGDINSENEQGAGVIKAIVNDSGNFVMWFMDNEHGILTGACKTPVKIGRFMAGKDVDSDAKREMVQQIISEILI